MKNHLTTLTQERRTSERKSTIANITISSRNEHPYEGKIFNISNGGISFATDLPLDLLTQVEVHVERSIDLPEKQHYSGKVVWGKVTGDLYSGYFRYGIKFVHTK